MEMLVHFTGSSDGLGIVPADRSRDWMPETPQPGATRCLPLLMANQMGWHVITTHDATVTYAPEPGRYSLEELTVEAPQPHPPCLPISNFGMGIVTWSLPFKFTTPAGWDLLAMPPLNYLLPDGVTCLSGLVETDTCLETFTLNWKLEPGTYDIPSGTVLAQLLPYPTNMLEEFQLVYQLEPPGRELYDWMDQRRDFNASARKSTDWQKTYWQKAKRRKIRVKEFLRRNDDQTL